MLKLLVYVTNAVDVDLYNAYVFVWFVVARCCLAVLLFIGKCTSVPITPMTDSSLTRHHRLG